ncbi:MAG: hypothetical protein J5497_03890, partial [Selenomonadaceae bacterium]|nr:hypothetical protein [Selenomonadaceae bacterium]
DTSNPDQKDLANEAINLFAFVCFGLRMPEEAMKLFLKSAEMASDDKPYACLKTSNAIFMASHIENFSADDFRKLYARYKKYLSDITPYPKKIYNHDRIRIGFLSADLYGHVVAKWGWALLTLLDRKKFAVYCYSYVRKADEVTDYLRKISDGWRDLKGFTPAQSAQIIRDDEIDILFDFSGHTPSTCLRIAAYRPATVQISGIGYMNTTGLDAFDYFLSDVHCAGNAVAMRDYFTEKIIVMPHSHICYEPDIPYEPADNPPCLANGYVTFGSFNNFSKITDSILCVWKKILDAVPNSRLLLKTVIFDTDDGKNFVIELLEKFGIDSSRVEMRGYTANHMREYDDVDIALDSFPYTGGVTTCEALYMGVPVISLYGDRHGTRFGYSILKNVGLDELIVSSYDEYISRAVALANDWELIDLLRKNLRGMMKRSPLMDGVSYVRAAEKIFAEILNMERNA